MMNKDEIIHGFIVEEVREIQEIQGTLYQLRHEKTNAQLAWLKRDDNNKTFTITFKTIPENDTGVFHILEHSVLNGSDLYPVKEPFVELLKGSMQTFLNAFTYPDKTMYPVSSRNDQDFMNLMSVYMDAVFHPAIKHNPNIFYQEGWHYEIRNREDEPVYKGVVLNEMKGAFSTVDEVLVNELNRQLFPDNCYRFVSGGDPEHIPDLSYEQFLKTHDKFYHPSNSRIFLDGDMDIDRVLNFIDEAYFSKYESETFDFVIPDQKEVVPSVSRIQYEVENEEEMHEKTQIAFARVVSDFADVKKNLAWEILAGILTANNEAPLVKAIIDHQLGEDVEFDIYNGIQQPWVFLNIRNTETDRFEKIQSVLKDVFTTLIRDGVDHHQIKAALNQLEFKYREKQEPAGVIYAQRAMNAWLYDGDPIVYLEQGYLFDELRNACDEGYFEALLSEFYRDGNLVTVIAEPSVERGAERVEKEQNRLHQEKENWGEAVQDYIALNETLDIWQATPDSAENLATLPKLALSDISRKPMKLTWENVSVGGVPVILHESADPEILYLNAYFSLAGVRREELPSLAFYTSLFMSLPTKNRSVEELQGYTRENLGSLRFRLESTSVAGHPESCTPVLGVHCSVLKKNVNLAMDLILEVLRETVFEAETILPLLKQANDGFKQALISSGHSIAMIRAAASTCADGVFKEYTDGYESGLYLKNLAKNYESEIGYFLQECQLYTDVLFCKERLTLSVNGRENLPVLEHLLDRLELGEGMRAKMRYPLLKQENEFIQIPGGVSYSATSGNLYQVGESQDIRMNVAAHMLTYDYLWNEVRVKGGAYGTGCAISPLGNVSCYSYRDPNPIHTLQVFDTIADYLHETKTDVDQMIIGTISASEPLLSTAAKVLTEDRLAMSEMTQEEREANRLRLLSMTMEDIREVADQIMKLDDSHRKCVIVGNEEVLKNLDGFQVLEKL